jgi:hypothetical protein
MKMIVNYQGEIKRILQVRPEMFSQKNADMKKKIQMFQHYI